MSGFQGADVDGLDTTASRMLQAAQACTTIATALAALATALEAMSWTGFAAAFAAYLRGVVIPWVKATGAALQAFGKLLELTSSDQKTASGDTPVITTGNGGYTSRRCRASRAATAPRSRASSSTSTAARWVRGPGFRSTGRRSRARSLVRSSTPAAAPSGGGVGAPVPNAPTPTPLPSRLRLVQ